VSVTDIIRDTATGAVATLTNQHEARGRTRLLARSAEDLLARMERLRARGSMDKVAVGLERGAVCQWVVDLTYRVMKCDYVGVAQIRDLAHAPEPLAEAGRLGPDRREWWEYVQTRVFTARRTREAEVAQPAGAALVLQLPWRRTTGTGRAQQPRMVCVIPMYVAAELTAVFAIAVRSSPLTLSDEIIHLARGMASTAAMTLEATAIRPKSGIQETTALRSALAEMDGALSLVSHELKSPLTTIMGCLQLVGQQVERLSFLEPHSLDFEKTAASIQERLGMASRSAQIEDRLADDLVEASRLRSGKLSLRPRLCDIGELVREVVGSQRAASHRIIHLEAPDEPIAVSADPDRIAQVIANFLGNALKYSPRAQPVEVRVDVLKTNLRVSVRDYGPGLEEPELKRIWQRFYRVKGVPVHSPTGSGLGLGLYISGEIIRGHGGKFGVKSVPSLGATFWFSLPLAKRA
jgi:signal transduction histidine kinase